MTLDSDLAGEEQPFVLMKLLRFGKAAHVAMFHPHPNPLTARERDGDEGRDALRIFPEPFRITPKLAG